MSNKKEEMKFELDSYLKEAVAYLRYSSHMQDGGVSIEYQIAEVEEYAKKNGYRIVEWYIDKATTAKEVAGRDNFIRLFKEIEAGKTPDTLIIWGTNRAFRNSIESAIHREKLRKQGIKLLSATQQLDDDSTSGRFMIDIIARVDQYKVEEIGEHVSAATRLLINEGFHAGGTAPFGYMVEKVMHNGKERKRIVPNEAEAPIVQEMYEMFLEGSTIRNIMTRLKMRGVTNRKGKPFARDTIRDILRNEVYMGSRTYRMKLGADAHSENYCEPLVSKEAFAKAQKVIEENRSKVRGRVRKNIYPLVGKLVCGDCGLAICGNSSGERSYYTCTSRRNRVACSNRAIRRDALDGIVLDSILEHILSGKAVADISKQIYREIKKSPAEAEDKKELAKRKDILQAEIAELVQMKLNGDISLETMNMLKLPKQDEVESIDRKLKEIELMFDSSIDEAYIKNRLKSIFDTSLLNDDCSPEILQELFNQTVERIEVSATQVVVHLRIALFSAKDKRDFGDSYHRLTFTMGRK